MSQAFCSELCFFALAEHFNTSELFGFHIVYECLIAQRTIQVKLLFPSDGSREVTRLRPNFLSSDRCKKS